LMRFLLSVRSRPRSSLPALGASRRGGGRKGRRGVPRRRPDHHAAQERKSPASQDQRQGLIRGRACPGPGGDQPGPGLAAAPPVRPSAGPRSGGPGGRGGLPAGDVAGGRGRRNDTSEARHRRGKDRAPGGQPVGRVGSNRMGRGYFFLRFSISARIRSRQLRTSRKLKSIWATRENSSCARSS